MAENRQVTPEKQLLGLIEDPKTATAPTIQQARWKWRRFGLLSLGSLRGAFNGCFSFFRRNTQKKWKSRKRSLNFALVTKTLMGLVVLCFLWVAGDTVWPAMSLMQPPNFAFQNEKTLAVDSQEFLPLKGKSEYLKKVSRRDIFSAFQEVQSAPSKKEVLPPDSHEKIKNLSLVGISWSANPDVIIEDKAKQKTFFLKQGQSVGGEAKVEAVYKDKVIVSLEGKEFELR